MLLIFALLMQVQVRVTVPTVRFEVAPPVVEVQPGVMVVRDYDEEVFSSMAATGCARATGAGIAPATTGAAGSSSSRGWCPRRSCACPRAATNTTAATGEIPRRQRRRIRHRIQGEAETRHDAGEGEAEEAGQMEMMPAAPAP